MVIAVEMSLRLSLLLSFNSFFFRLRCAVEPVILRRPEDAHHPGRPGRADQRCDHPSLGLGHLPTHAGGPQAAPALLPSPPQRHWLPAVSASIPHTASIPRENRQFPFNTSFLCDWMTLVF